ncbi:MAG: alpha-pore-forming cytotoxin MakA [Solirubrobacterales bacterium]
MSQPILTAIEGIGPQTKKSFLTLNMITQACHGVANTVFVPPPTKPVWFDDLNKKLDVTKGVAHTWIDTLAPSITGGVPKAVLDYNPTYEVATEEIEGIVRAHPDAEGKDDPYVKQVRALIEVLREPVVTTVEEAKQIEKELEAWGKEMQSAHDGLSSGTGKIQEAETSLATEIKSMEVAIENLEKKIHDENIAIAVSAGGVGLGCFLLVVGIALAPISGGASLLVGGTGGLLIIGGAVTWGIMEAKIREQFKQIGEEQNKIAADKRQLVALKGLSTGASQAINYSETALNSLSEFRTTWHVFEGELQGVANKLQKGEKSLSTLLQGTFTKQAAKEWADAAALAHELITTEPKVASKEVSMLPSAQAA